MHMSFDMSRKQVLVKVLAFFHTTYIDDTYKNIHTIVILTSLYMSNSLSSKISMYDGTHQFFSLDTTVIEGVLCNALSDPTYLMFRVFFDFESTSGLFASEYENATNTTVNRNSALAYFTRIGDTKRHAELDKLIKLLRSVQTSAFHCFESIAGLKDAWTRTMSDVRIKDKFIELKLTESVDWRMATIAALIRNIIYDYERMVYVLPVNLRAFNMFVYVTELRIFAEATDNAGNFLNDANEKIFGISDKSFGSSHLDIYNSSTITGEILKYMQRNDISNERLKLAKEAKNATQSTTDMPNRFGIIEKGVYMLFGFSGCSFTTDTGSSFFADIDHTQDAAMAHGNMKISYANVSIEQKTPIIGTLPSTVVVESMKNKNLIKESDNKYIARLQNSRYGAAATNAINDISNTGFDATTGVFSVKTLVKNLVNKAKDAALAYAEKLALSGIDIAIAEANMQISRVKAKAYGNAYGFNAGQLYAFTNPQYAWSRAKAGLWPVKEPTNPLAIEDVKRQIDNQGGVYPQSDNTQQTAIPSDTIYDKPGQQQKTIALGNAYPTKKESL